MKRTFEENRTQLGDDDRERIWNDVAARTVRAHAAERSPQKMRRSSWPSGSSGWRRWAPMTVAAAASVVLALTLWDRAPGPEDLPSGKDRASRIHARSDDAPAAVPSPRDQEAKAMAAAPAEVAPPETAASSERAEMYTETETSAETEMSVETGMRAATRQEADGAAAVTSAGDDDAVTRPGGDEPAAVTSPEIDGGTELEVPALREEEAQAKAANPEWVESAPPSASASPSAPLNSGEIVGRLLDQEGHPVAYANIVILGTQWGSMTGRDGTFRIDDVPPGSYTVRAQIIGYTADDTSGVVVDDAPVSLALQVERSSVGSLGEIGVRGTAQREAMGPPVGQPKRDGRGGVRVLGDAARVRGDEDGGVEESVASGEGSDGTRGRLEERTIDLEQLSVNEAGEALGLEAGTASKSEDRHFRGGRAGEVDASAREADRSVRAPYDAVSYQDYGSNPLVSVDRDRFSTFAVDVDRGSYTIARRYVTDGYLPEPAAVRVEEFVNSFDPGYPRFDDADFRIHVDGAPSPFREGFTLLRVGLQARTVDAAKRPPARLTFVVDVSGSMERENRLGLVRASLRMLLGRLRADDQVAIVAYGSEARVVLPPTSAEESARIEWGIEQLASGGSTNAEDGLRLGYEQARSMYRQGAINRILLCSDGVANVGVTGPEAILETVRTRSDDGIQLTTIGFGMGNYNDVLMEQLANQGDGAYYYVDQYDEAERVLGRELTGTLLTVARDAKVQVEFDPDVVASYRLLGFENRAVADRDFRNDRVDAGEVGSGHTVVALYEVLLREPGRDGGGGEELATVRLRYERPSPRGRGGSREEGGEVREISRDVRRADLGASFERSPWRFRLGAAAAQYAEILRNSYWAQDARLADLVPLAADLAFYLRDDPDVVEFARLVEQAAEVEARMTPAEWESRWPRLEARAPEYPPRR